METLCGSCVYDDGVNLIRACDTHYKPSRVQAQERRIQAGVAPQPSTGTKPTNPKDAIGTNKVNLGLFPDTARIAGALAFTEGALKYGRYNWRVAGVRASIYKDALDRHMSQWWNGEDMDGDSQMSHLFKALACIAVLIDSQVCGKLTDDRPPRAPVTALLNAGTAITELLHDRYGHVQPQQYTIDSQLELPL
jgi:hypothetical protein